MRISFRSFDSAEPAEPLSSTCAAFAHCSKESSCVTPRSRVMGSYFWRPRPLRMTALPPSLYSITSLDRLIAPILLTPATGDVLVSKYTRKRKQDRDRKSTRLNSSHQIISYAVFCLKK